MAEIYDISVSELRSYCDRFRIGDKVLLTGYIYTSRDAAHKRFDALLNEGKPLSFEMKDAVIYYAGPTPAQSKSPVHADLLLRDVWINLPRDFLTADSVL